LLADANPNSAHVRDCNLKKATDAEIWEYAKADGYAIVSKDSDFRERSVLWGRPPKVIWLRVPNCKSAEIARILLGARTRVKESIEGEKETCLLLGR